MVLHDLPAVAYIGIAVVSYELIEDLLIICTFSMFQVGS
jgi:hypothetical protein